VQVGVNSKTYEQKHWSSVNRPLQYMVKEILHIRKPQPTLQSIQFGSTAGSVQTSEDEGMM